MPTPKVVKRRPLRDLVLDAAEVALSSDGAPPTRLRLAAFGKNETAKGPFTLNKADAEAMVARYKARGIKLHADYEHAAVHAVAKGTEAPAAAWYDLELGQDGLYAANIEWTPPALQRLKNREYRYWSPWLGQREDGSVGSFKNFALTNRPAMDGLAPLVAAENDASDEAPPPEKPKMDPTLLKMLLLSEDATDAQVAARITAMNAERDAIFTATETKDLPAALAAIETAKRGAAEALALKAKLEEATRGAEKKEREMLLSEAVESGAIPPNMKDFWASETMGLAQLKAYLEKAPKVAPKGKGGAADPKEKDLKEADLALTEDDKTMARHFGMTDEDFAKQKKLTLGRV